MLRAMADVLRMEGADRFRVRAYLAAADSVEDHAESLAAMLAESPDRLLEVRGIGRSLAQQIEEFVRTGESRSLQRPERRALAGAADLLRVPGIGPRRARLLAQRLGVRTLAELAEKARAGQVRTVPGFGPVTERRILGGIDAVAAAKPRLLRPPAIALADRIASALLATSGVSRVAIGGSCRRACESVGRLRFVASGTEPALLVERFTTHGAVRQVLESGAATARVVLNAGPEASLHVVSDDAFGAALFCLTGTQAHVGRVRDTARARQVRIGLDGIFRGEGRAGGRDEEEVYAAAGLPWIHPELREDRGELEAARAGRLADLLTRDDVRGDLQSHSTDSDGRSSLEQMAAGAESLGYEYLAITDHSPSLRVARGLDAAGFRRQGERIDVLNGRLERLTVLKGAEVDILLDGSLDLDDETLATFDIVLVSLHSRLALPAAEQTRRIVRAISHRRVDVFAHPAGRMIGRRPGAAFDADEVFRAALDNDVMLEVNGQPDRLDLDDALVQRALDRGVRLTLGTDAHSVSELGFMRWAVDQARRGWARRSDVANTLPLADLRGRLAGRR
jgi:DNA polymerase (family 10)